MANNKKGRTDASAVFGNKPAVSITAPILKDTFTRNFETKGKCESVSGRDALGLHFAVCCYWRFDPI